MRALLWRSGRGFPLALLGERLRCPVCGSREIAVAFDVPSPPSARDGDARRYLVEQIDARGGVVETITRGRFAAALQLFDDLVARKPGCRFVFRDGGRVVRTHPRRAT